MGYLTEPIPDIDKEAVAPWLKAGVGLGLKGLWLKMGADYAGDVVKNIGDTASTTPVGEQSRQQWQAEINRDYNRRANTPQHAQARANVTKGKWLGAGAGLLASLPFALKKRAPLPGIGAAILGKGAGGWLANRKNPMAAPRGSMIDAAMNQYASLFTPQQRAELLEIRNSPEIMNNPQKQQQIAAAIAQKASLHPKAQKITNRGKTFSNIGKVLGGAGMLAMMLKGKGAVAGQGLVKRLGGSLMPAYLGLAAAGTGANLLNTHIAGRRANLTSQERKNNLTEAATGQDMGLNMLFYGSMLKKPKWLGK